MNLVPLSMSLPFPTPTLPTGTPGTILPMRGWVKTSPLCSYLPWGGARHPTFPSQLLGPSIFKVFQSVSPTHLGTLPPSPTFRH